MGFFKKIWQCINGIFSFINTYFKVIVLLLIVLFIMQISSHEDTQARPNLAKLYLNFPIYESETFAKQIEAIQKHKNIKGVLLLIDSPGGSVGASIEIADMIKELNSKIPVIAYTQSLMASGSYYAGMYSSKIYANRGALIGSIGVIFSAPNFEKIMEKFGIAMQGTHAGEYKEIGTITRKWNPKEQDFINELTQEQYHMFYSDVIEAREGKLITNNPKEFADGKIFSANHALKLGLIDKVGSMSDAIKALQEASGVKEIVWLKKDKTDILIDKVLDSAITKMQSLTIPSFMWQYRHF